jgi:hypothetical protein
MSMDADGGIMDEQKVTHLFGSFETPRISDPRSPPKNLFFIRFFTPGIFQNSLDFYPIYLRLHPQFLIRKRLGDLARISGVLVESDVGGESRKMAIELTKSIGFNSLL